MKLLAVGGPRHGEWLPYKNGQLTLVMPIPSDIRKVDWSGDPPRATIELRQAVYWRKVIADRVCWEYQGR